MKVAVSYLKSQKSKEETLSLLDKSLADFIHVDLMDGVFVSENNLNLVLSGHAHGGHWRLFGRGVYAPGQGLFPKYTAGVVDGVCVISRGLGDHTSIPRLFNEPELVMIRLGK